MTWISGMGIVHKLGHYLRHYLKAFYVVGAWWLLIVAWVWHFKGFHEACLALAAHFVLVSMYMIAMWVCHGLRILRPLRWVFYGVASLFIMVQVLAIIYYFAQDVPLDPSYVLDSEGEVLETVANVIGMGALLQAVSLVVFLSTAGSFAFASLQWRKPKNYHYYYFPLALVLLWFPYSGFQMIKSVTPFLSLSSRDFQLTEEAQQHGLTGKPGAVALEYGPFHSDSGEPVIILQLESGNGLAMMGAATPEHGPQELIPQMYGAHKGGVMMSHVWGPTIRTHRAQGAILCSSTMDIFDGVSFNLTFPEGKCLPALLKADGYETVFGSAYNSGGYANTENFMAAIGFNERHFGDFMQPEDKWWSWGYDDCQFYHRFFDFLEKKFTQEQMSKRFFAYFEVSSNHCMFESKDSYADIWPFPKPQNFAEEYLNSVAVQDHCVGEFMKRVEKYRDKAHIFILPDHSWPVGMDGGSWNAAAGAAPENFMINMVYLPPRKKAAEYRTNVVVTQPVGEDDIFPTILDLLSGKYYPQSFASLLRAPKDGVEPTLPKEYDDCHVMTQPYDGTQVAVVRGMKKYTYNITQHTMVTTLLQGEHLKESTLVDEPPRDMSYVEFLHEFQCDRYRYWEPHPDFPKPTAYINYY